MRHKICHTKNIARLAEAGDSLIHRSAGTPGMGLVSGASGNGKTTAITWFAIRCEGIHVRAMASWCPSAMLTAILRELDIEMHGNNAEMTSRVVEKLAERQSPLFVDEADYLVRSSLMMETLRDIHDVANVPVILVGEENMHRKLVGYERLTRRLAHHVKFTGSDMEDARALAEGLCEVKVSDDLLEQLHATACIRVTGAKETVGDASAGRIVVGLARIEQLARAKGVKEVGLKHWPRGKSFFEGGPIPAAPSLNAVSNAG